MKQRSNDDWRRALAGAGPAREQALADLRAVLVKGLGYALRGWRKTAGRDFESLTEDFVQEALLRILDNLGSFEGRSRFTTWAHKIAIRTALTELRRKRWQDVSLDKLVSEEAVEGLMADAGAGPAAEAERSDTVSWLRRLIGEELTDRQRQAITAVAFTGMPIEEAARRLDTNRNALYKLIHDARLRLKRRLDREGTSPGDILTAMNER